MKQPPIPTSLSPGECLIAIGLAFALFFTGYIVRGWSTPNVWDHVALVVPDTSSYDCKIGDGGNSHFIFGSGQH